MCQYRDTHMAITLEDYQAFMLLILCAIKFTLHLSSFRLLLLCIHRFPPPMFCDVAMVTENPFQPHTIP